jgi:uncharacterized protein YqjF (DUF2071 family)
MPYQPDPPDRVRFPVMLQSWRTVTFLHWGYEPRVVRRLVPGELELETYGGLAWVSVTPFLLDNLRPPGVPALPWISTTPETNVRTYVRRPGGQSGIWFFSLDIARLPAALAGRAAYGVPYLWSDLTVHGGGGRMRYTGRRRWPGGGGRYDVVVEPGERYRDDELTELDHFLTARYVLYARLGPLSVMAFVEHPRWPLARATLLRLEENLLANAGLPMPTGEPLVHFSPGVDTRIGRPRLASRAR